MSQAVERALAQLLDLGLRVESLEFGRLVRCPVEGDRGAAKSGWYSLHEMRTAGGEVVVVGAFGNWRTGERDKVSLRGQSLSAEERAVARARVEEDRKAAERERKRLAGRAAARARWAWEHKLREQGRSPYLERKQVGAHGVRFGSRGAVAVPVADVDGQLRGLQIIWPEKQARHGRDKDFWPPGMEKRGHCHRMGPPGPVMLVAEGYATAASLHEATSLTVVAALDAGNLLPVGQALRKRWPDARLVFCADDDFMTDGNPGVTQAEMAALAVSGSVVVPQFAGRTEKWTDFNDLALQEGPAAVRMQVMAHLGALPLVAARTPTPPWGQGGGSGEEGDPGEWAFGLEALVRRYVLIYGTETVFDERRRRILGLSALRAAAGKDLVGMWQKDPRRRIVAQEGVVFDPSQRADPRSTVNLFRGWPRQPSAGRCDLLLELLHYICGESEAVTDWVLRWTAYPLQHPGAKMRTAVIMHGPEGTGKNTWWGAVREIYGDYGVVITQTELESQFNGWASAKLFVIGNEVVSRQEMYHQSGRLRNMITEPEWAVNEKMLPVRMEANHANFVFLSNVTQPGTPRADDRRYLVVWTPYPREEEFYRAVQQQAEDGGVEALYQYLLEMDLQGFTPHTKPIMTEAKEDLIEASMESHERFRRQWLAGELSISPRPCLSMDLYRAYRRWCDTRGERAPAREAVFLAATKKHLRALRKRVSLPGQGMREHQGTVFFPPGAEMPPGGSERQWLTDEICFFREEMGDGDAS